MTWKQNTETQYSCKWIKHNGSSKLKGKSKITYYCNRSRKKRIISTEQRKRMLKSQGSCKTDLICTSRIVLKESSDSINVKYFKNHYGHDINMVHIPLSTSEKETIAAKLLQGIPASEILDQIRESVDENFKRIHLTTKKDIHNISLTYNVNEKIIKDKNDAVSVDLWVKELSQTTENSILLYKKQGFSSNENFLEKKKDFLLGIMTECQMQLFKKFGNNGIVCMDATHAFLFANREDYTVIKYFIIIKEKVGDINVSVFMSDDADQYFTAWSSVMNTTQTKKLLCVWHVDRAWRKKINIIKNKAKQEYVYKMLCVVRQEINLNDFNKYIESFLNLLAQDEDLTEFKNYFEKHYLNRCSSWAACYRLGSSINTNMYLESMHKVLKYIYLKGTACRRLDKTIFALLKFIKNKQFDRIIKLNKGKVSNKISMINKRHLTATTCDSMYITSDDAAEQESVVQEVTSWTVHSDESNYTVKKIDLSSSHECKLKCVMCECCVHVYSCTCTDYLIHAVVCKHIHKVCIINKKDISTSNEVHNNEDKEEIQMHLKTLKRNNNLQTLHTEINNNITEVSEYCKTSKNYDLLSKINNYLKLMKKMVDSEPGPAFMQDKQKNNNPVNKKIDVQPRFQSTKKKRNAVIRLGKPSPKEVDYIHSMLNEN